MLYLLDATGKIDPIEKKMVVANKKIGSCVDRNAVETRDTGAGLVAQMHPKDGLESGELWYLQVAAWMIQL